MLSHVLTNFLGDGQDTKQHALHQFVVVHLVGRNELLKAVHKLYARSSTNGLSSGSLVSTLFFDKAQVLIMVLAHALES